jgi:hypothetical protein
MYPIMASFFNKITNNVSQGLESVGGGHMCSSTFLVFFSFQKITNITLEKKLSITLGLLKEEITKELVDNTF